MITSRGRNVARSLRDVLYNKYRPCTIPGHSLHLLHHSTNLLKLILSIFLCVKMKKVYYIVVIFIYIYLNLSFIDFSSNLTNKYSTSLFLFHNVVHRWRSSHHISIQAVNGILKYLNILSISKLFIFM